MKYDKLIRDKIPDIITKQGKRCVVQTLTGEQYLQKLEQKLSEELNEYLESRQLEELADLLEVMEALVAARGETWQQLRQLQLSKREQRGGFGKKLLLTEVQDG